MTTTLVRDGSRVYLDPVDTYQVCDPMYECVRVALAARGEDITPAYVQGVSGGAFRIAGICPCAPTCGVAMWVRHCIELLGFAVQHVAASSDDPAATEAAIAAIRGEIDAGRAVPVFHAFTNAEWDVVCGYDTEKETFLGRGSYGGSDGAFAEKPWARMAGCGDICPPEGALLIGARTHTPDARTIELAALRDAVRHARAPLEVREDGKWAMAEGLACYDRWVADFRTSEKRRDSGDAYCYGVFRSRRRQAAPFLREIAPHFPDVADTLEAAAQAFAREADILQRGETLLWWNSPGDGSRNAEAADLLAEARDAYAEGIGAMERAIG